MFQRIKRAYNAFKGTDLLIIERSEMTPEQAKRISEVTGKSVILANDIDKYKFSDSVEIGDGKAEFLGEGTSDEYQEQQERDKGFKNKPFGL